MVLASVHLKNLMPLLFANPIRLFGCLLVLSLLTQCGAPGPPVCRLSPPTARAQAPMLIETARINWKILSNPAQRTLWPAAEIAYNSAVSSLFDKMRCGGNDWAAQASEIGTSLARPTENLKDLRRLEALFPAAAVKVKTKERYNKTEGLGIAAVGWRSTSPVGVPREQFLPPNGQPFNLTAILDFSAGTPQWKFVQRWDQSSFAIGPTSHKLAADWTAPIDFFWYMCDLDDLRLQNVIIPERFTEETGLYFLEPYDPDKIPVVMVHGLVSSPDAYRDIINDLSPEPWFRENYQIWLYNYPTGTPWLYNAMRFRQIMGTASAYARRQGPDAKLKQMVILSHSMGGLLTRTAVSPPGKFLYDAHFPKPLSELKIKRKTRTLLEDALLYTPLKDPARVVFMAVPHRGSPAANFRGTAFLSNLIRLPKILTVDLIDATLQATAGDAGLSGDIEAAQVKPPTSISTLSPSYSGFEGLSKMRLPQNIIFHSILGDKGHGDTPKSSDGVVPYWSSHLDEVSSELIVPSNHSVPSSPAAAAEVQRILRLHIGKP